LQANFTGSGALKNGAGAFDVLCYDDIPLTSFGGITGGVLDQGTLPWAQVGLDFTTDGSELFIVDPELDRLFILDTSTNELVMEGGVPKTIAVGDDPFDVEILNVEVGGVMQDRAYVANNGDDTLTIVDVVGRAPVGLARILADDFQGLTDLQVETMAGSEASQLLFLVSPNRERVLRYKLDGEFADGDNPDPLLPFVVGPSPRRVALEK